MGLHHAHQRGLVHRDIKPGNLMLDRHGLLKVLDLGLGKFQADVLHGDYSMGPLTQVGTTMGTVDYMAPEQWDDPTTVDIRADIYSLGNTLYFLLCGNPPFDGKNYASNRAKLLAHIVAEPPSLQEACPEVPPELEAVYMKFVAKESQNRYQTPLEAAEALAPFADANALREAIPQELKNISDADRSTSSEYDHSAGRDTIASYPYSPSRRQRISELAPSPEPWYRHKEFYAFVALLSVVLLVVAGVMIARLGGDNPALPPDISNIYGTDNPLQGFNPSERDAVIADLVELPGLSGTTWFLEMPWFTPFVRQAAADMLSQTTKPELLLGNNLKGYLDPDSVSVQQWLWTLTKQTRDKLTPAQWQLVTDLKELADSNLELNEYADKTEAALNKFVEANAGLPLRAVNANTEAMLYHTLSGLKVDKDLDGFAKSAQAKYLEALNAYGTDTVSKQLKLLCMTDMARLVGQTLNKYEESRSMYDKVRNSEHATNLLKADVLISLAVDQATQGEPFEFHFRNARILLNGPNSVNIGQNHPLIAHIAERHAWCLIDRWQVNDAKTFFEEALDIRVANSREGKNPFADIYVIHNKHGLAMTERYRGDPVIARQRYDEVIALIDEKLTDAEKNALQPDQQMPGQLRYLRELRERLTNSRYRRADCELFGGAASGESGINFVRAEEWYEQSMLTTNDRATQAALSIKFSLILALRGKIAEANAPLAKLDETVKMIVSPVARFRTQQFINTLRQIIAICEAERTLATSEPTTEALMMFQQEINNLRTLLRQIADDEALDSTDTVLARYNNNRPEMLEFRLFCLEFLFNAEKRLAVHSKNSSGSDVQRLRNALSVFSELPEMMPYARRYYDLAIHVADKSDLTELVSLLQNKMGRPVGFAQGNDAGRAWQLFFHFSPTDNFVILQTDDSQMVEYQPLTLTREEINNSANRGEEILPQPELAKILAQVRDARDAGRIVNIYWNDQRCWPLHEKNAISDDDWPFESVLSLRDVQRD